MATSGTQTFKLDASDLIEEAYERCGLEMRTGYDAKTARRSLNILMSDWANRGINLWTVKQGTQTLTKGTASYALDPETVDLLDVVIRRNGVDYAMERIGRSTYLSTPNKATEGRPTQFWVDRQSTPVLYVYPAPENSTDQVVFYRTERIEDVNALSNDVDIPSRFIAPLISGLAYFLSMKKAPERVQGLKAVYEEEMLRAETEDRERVSLRMIPGRGRI